MSPRPQPGQHAVLSGLGFPRGHRACDSQGSHAPGEQTHTVCSDQHVRLEGDDALSDVMLLWQSSS